MTTLSLKSSSLSFNSCTDDIRFSFENNILDIVTRKTNEEKLQFNIIEISEEIINNVTHTVLKSDQGDIFYIVNNQFHREDDKPAIIMQRYTIGADYFDEEKGFKIWAKIWMKNGLYHREDDKPALIFKNGDLLWMLEGHFKRNPYTNASIYTPNDNLKLMSCERTNSSLDFDSLNETEMQRHIKEKLLEFSYDNA